MSISLFESMVKSELKSKVLVADPLLLRRYPIEVTGVKMTTFTVAGTLYRESTRPRAYASVGRGGNRYPLAFD